jgi:hypothetical protein
VARRERERIHCAHCGRPGWKAARGLISTCHKALWAAGQLGDWPRVTFDADSLLDEWFELASNPPEGVGKADIARRIGIKVATLDRALDRARLRGDPRAIYAVNPLTGRRFEPGREPDNPIKARDRARADRYRRTRSRDRSDQS